VNLILFSAEEIARPLLRSDARAHHLLRVLGRKVGDTFDVGCLNGARGKGKLVAVGDEALDLSFTWGKEPPPLPPRILLIGLPRPQTARDILRDATTLGASAIHFVSTARSDPNYASSSLWSSGEWRRHLVIGAEQAFDTRLPEVTWTHSLTESLATLPSRTIRLALDLYEARAPLSRCHLLDDIGAVVVALGPERGWDAADREALRAAGFTLVHLGSRVLRTETAVVAALAVVEAMVRERAATETLK